VTKNVGTILTLIFYEGDIYTTNLFAPRPNSHFMEKNIALFMYYFMECITFKFENSKNCRNLQKEIF
jgi:hypothetical protein